MAEEDNKLEEQTEGSTENETEEGSTEAKVTSKKKSNLLILALSILVVIILSIVGVVFLTSGGEESEQEAKVAEVQAPSIFYEMPEIIVSLSSYSSNIRYLKLVLSLEIATPEDQAIVVSQLPKITDEFQTYLRQLRLEDLRGSVGTYRLKEALLLRVNQVVQPVEVKDVLLKEMLIQ